MVLRHPKVKFTTDVEELLGLSLVAIVILVMVVLVTPILLVRATWHYKAEIAFGFMLLCYSWLLYVIVYH